MKDGLLLELRSFLGSFKKKPCVTDLSTSREITRHKPVILTFLRYYLPGYKSGGPVRAIANLVDVLGDEFEFRIVTADRDKMDIRPYSGVDTQKWHRVGKAWVYYVPGNKAGFCEWKDILEETPHDLIYLNSLYAPWYTLMPLLVIRLSNASERPLLIAPRGELSTEAIDIKGWKKKPFLFMTKLLGFYRDVLWHASSEHEAVRIRENMGVSSNVAVAIDVPATVGLFSGDAVILPPPNGSLNVVFLSRISKMKNLDYALKILCRTSIELRFDVWGILEDPDYWKLCQGLIRSMPKNVEVRYRGEATPEQAVDLLAGYDLLFLPTRGESYGHVIAEALSAGTPLLISDKTPWQDLAAQGVGWDLPLDEDGAAFLQAIEEANEKDSSERELWRQHVLKYAELHLCNPSIIETNRQLFLKAMPDSSQDISHR